LDIIGQLVMLSVDSKVAGRKQYAQAEGIEPRNPNREG
jgi:hypothetical protein